MTWRSGCFGPFRPVLCGTGCWWSSPPAAPSDSTHQSINQYANQSINTLTNQLLVIISPRCTIHHRILHINPLISTPINQSTNTLTNQLLLITPGCTIGFCTSIHQLVCQSINQYTNKSITGDYLPRLHHRILHINPSISMPINQSIHYQINYCWSSPPAAPSDSAHQSINQYANQSNNTLTNQLLVIISPSCTIGFCTSIHQSLCQSINTLPNQFTSFFRCNCVKKSINQYANQ